MGPREEIVASESLAVDAKFAAPPQTCTQIFTVDHLHG